MPERRSSRYGRYHGGPDPLAPPVDLAEALDAIAEDVMAVYETITDGAARVRPTAEGASRWARLVRAGRGGGG